ncbi:MAG: GNAT family N-acetyltransferase [Roseovarius sp.]
MIHIRPAGLIDAAPLAELLNEIIAAGGTTALTEPVSAEDLKGWMQYHSGRNAWHLAEDDTGQALGFQYIEPKDTLPPEGCDIATFARRGHSGLGVGSKLFEATKRAAAGLGYRWINATIRADNAGGLAYYQSRGFEDYARQANVPIAKGLRVDRISKRFDL